MKLYDRLILGTFLRYVGYTLFGSLVLFVLVDVFDHLGSLLDNDATMSQVLRYYLYKSALILDIALPVALLMATLFTVGSMARYLELTALFASGLGILNVARSLLVAGAFFTLASMAWHEFVLPEANLRRWRVWEVEIHKRMDTAQGKQRITLTGEDGRIYYVRRYDPQASEIRGLKVVELDSATVVMRLDAERAAWDGESWTLRQAIRRRFTAGREEIERFEELPAPELALKPEALARSEVRYEQMNVRQLLAHQRLVEQTGGDPVGVRVDIQFQLAFPLVNLIVVFLGVILASGPRKTTIASGFGLTLAIGFGYYVLMNLGRALGEQGVLPPLLSVWAGNGVYMFGAWVLYARSRR